MFWGSVCIILKPTKEARRKRKYWRQAREELKYRYRYLYKRRLNQEQKQKNGMALAACGMSASYTATFTEMKILHVGACIAFFFCLSLNISPLLGKCSKAGLGECLKGDFCTNTALYVGSRDVEINNSACRMFGDWDSQVHKVWNWGHFHCILGRHQFQPVKVI